LSGIGDRCLCAFDVVLEKLFDKNDESIML
jgi:hypothetical protein